MLQKMARAKSIPEHGKAQWAALATGTRQALRIGGDFRWNNCQPGAVLQVVPAARPNLQPAGNQSKTITGGNMMKLMAAAMFVMLFCAAALNAGDKTVFDYTLSSIDGQPAPLSTYKGKVVMLVNVASRCGFTPQYSALEAIYEKYKERGFVIVGIPANNFGSQEPGTNQEIKTFCQSKYNVKFPMMSKVSVKGDDQTPLYQFLTDKSANPKTGGDIQWNFTKFLIGPDGQILARFEPKVTPDSPEVTSAIESALASLKR
jgi:glutathione peroxidase